MAWAPPSKVGDRDPAIVIAKAKAARYSYGKDLGDSDAYTEAFGKFLAEFKARVHADVLAGKRLPPDVDPASTALDWATKVQLGLIARAPVPPPPPVYTAHNRHLAVVFRGTGGVVGADYVSRVCQAVSDRVEEVNPPWAATMGGLPVGTAGSIGDPSMAHGAQAAFAAAQHTVLTALAANPDRRIIIGGYSAGAVVAAMLRQWVLANFADNYLCSFSLGDPTRPFGGSYYLGPVIGGQGISSWRYGDVHDWRHCYLANPDDMYTNVPLGDTGQIMQDAYDMVTQIELSDFMGMVMALIPAIPKIAADSGISLPGAFAALAGGPVGLVTFALPMLIGMLPGLIGGIGGGNANTLTGPAAAAQAAIIALKFLAAGTGPHITYEFNEVWPGQTYLGLAIQHVADYAHKVAPV